MNTEINYTNESTYRKTRLPVQLAHTLIPDAYRNAAYHELELSRVFEKSWVCVGYASELKETGDTIVSVVGEQPIFVLKNKKGELRAYHNVCRHRGSELIQANTRLEHVVRCPYHAWGYDFDGKLLGTPYFKGLDVPEAEKKYFDTSQAKEFCKDDYGLLPVRVDTWGCLVFVCLDTQAPTLTQWLGDLPTRFVRHPLAELQLHSRAKFEIQANWKLIAENFMEYYHLPWVHPELSTVSGVNEHHRYQGPGMYTGMCTSPLTENPDSDLDFLFNRMPGLSPIESRSAYWIYLFPNVAMFLLPNHLFTLVLRPNGINRTIESADMLVHPSALGHERSSQVMNALFKYWDMVNRQDILAVERVQTGLRAKAYPGGRMCYRFEESIHRFQNMVIDKMVARLRIPQGDEVQSGPSLQNHFRQADASLNGSGIESAFQPLPN